jgi:hemoglobin
MAYGEGDTSFQTAGGDLGLRQLSDAFYDHMLREPQAQKILTMHPEDLEQSRDKLARFLCGWLGGPSRYNEKYGRINIPAAHRHLDVGDAEREAWLLCMAKAIDEQPYPGEFKTYLLDQLAVPAQAVQRVSQRRQNEEAEQGQSMDNDAS